MKCIKKTKSLKRLVKLICIVVSINFIFYSLNYKKNINLQADKMETFIVSQMEQNKSVEDIIKSCNSEFTNLYGIKAIYDQYGDLAGVEKSINLVRDSNPIITIRVIK